MRILEADHGGLDAVAVKFFEKLAGSSGSATPRDVVAILSGFVEVVHLDGEDAVFQETDGFDGIDAVSQPVAEVGCGADALAAAFAEREHHLGLPEMRGDVGAVVVEADVDGILIGKFVQQIELLRLRFADEGFHAHLVAELEELAAGCFVRRDGLGVVNRHAYAGGFHFQADLKQLFVGKTLVEVLRDVLCDLLHETESADVGQTEFGGLLDGFEEGELVEGVGLDADAPAELLLGSNGGC